MTRTPQVMQCYYVTGHADFMIIMTATDLQDYADLAIRLFAQNPNVRRFEPSLVVSRIKFG
jgi:Lrp/AsnC family leucine-responsive transcriptional regulator